MRNYNSKLEKEIEIQQLDLTYIDTIDKQNALNCQQWTT